MSVKLTISDKAPDFLLQGDDSKDYSLSDFDDRKLILYFYPKDNTPGCTKEAVGFSENYEQFLDKNYYIVGISPDSASKHKSFKERYDIPFLLLSDPEKKVAAMYGAYGEKRMYGKSYKGIIRSTFLIDKKGIVRKTYYNVKVKEHIMKVLDEITNLEKGS